MTTIHPVTEPVTINTVTGPVSVDDLGPTLVHEHLAVGYAGWEAHTNSRGSTRAEMKAICIDRIASIQALGYRTMIDPCPNDLGRDVDFMVEVAQATGFNIICATGLYKEEEGGTAYWHFRKNFGPLDGPMGDLFIAEITDGVGTTGVRPGVIKVATGHGHMTDYERSIFLAAARAAVQTGTPITTHTDQGTIGDLQQALLVEQGVPAHRIVIGHSCGTDDFDYHWKIAEGGSYLGFDRFGLSMLMADEKRVKALLRLLDAGVGDRIVASHDNVWCWKGEPIPAPYSDRLADVMNPTHFHQVIRPMLLEGGATEAQVDALTGANPRRWLAGEALETL